ncbi:sensor histidine kinase [Phocaeicola dorei]|uniref:sensor histidine kinase n=4 Tax=Bacteroidales TaxID=171549 RepID=UPI0013A67557|nr:HAMP domain-containing sensor histidine kinase [Phocaeicola dorei]MBS6339237.1 HAMP domain-containing histidine kinase [Bacteroides ovatus]MCE8576357.1 HAMP domain-containing histidine kinase [Bacteroides fragilis]UBD12049.1 HAMP domain-containing histidine kinase [Bacteroides thetaiotaomicron]
MMLAIAHDLRSPLTTITGSADLLPGEKDGRRKAKYVENIRHTSEYILSLVDTLMDFYLLDTGQAQSYERIFHLESLFKETVDNYAPLAQRKRLLLSSGFSGTDVVVCGDKSHLQQIVNNLLSNALKFTKEGSVRLEAEYRNGELHLCVRDTGTGMDEKDAERIFTAFERLENARGVSGFGLGLAICSRQVSRMGSSIRVESRKGQGSEFIVLLLLPPADGKSPLDTEKLSQHLHMEGTRVLVLDDDLRQLGIVKEMLLRHAMNLQKKEE